MLINYILPALALGLMPAMAGAAGEEPSAHPPITMEMCHPVEDLDGDGRVSAEEFGRQSPRFQALDADGDGALSAEEREAAQRRHRQHGVAALAMAADADRDGSVSAAEWEGHVSALDADGDGMLAVEDLSPHRLMLRHHVLGHFRTGQAEGGDVVSPGRWPRRAHHPPFGASLLDADGDGLVPVAELDAAFAELDADGDGELAPDELPCRGRGRAGWWREFEGQDESR